MATTMGTCAARACSIASMVCGMTPSSAATTRTTTSVAFAPRARIIVKASWPGVSRKTTRRSWSGLSALGTCTLYAPMCCVMPPASPAATFAARMPSSKLVLPWSTCPMTVTTGARASSVSSESDSINCSNSSGDHLLEAEELHVEAEALAQLLRDVVVERLVERGEDAALKEHRLNVLRANAELVGELLDGRALDESNLLEVGRAAGRVDGLRDAVFEPERLGRDYEVSLEASAPAALVAGKWAAAASAPSASARSPRVGGRDVSGLRRGGLAGRPVEARVNFAASPARAS